MKTVGTANTAFVSCIRFEKRERLMTEFLLNIRVTTILSQVRALSNLPRSRMSYAVSKFSFYVITGVGISLDLIKNYAPQACGRPTQRDSFNLVNGLFTTTRVS